jgi:NAD(P)-dependent dehydrogenase (short-subunit alcohol dehydrogenase family)
MSEGRKEAEAQVVLQDFPNIFSLKGKVAVISGGSRGLGLHSASGLLQFGCSKVFITSRKASACEEACAALNALPNKAPGAIAIPVPADSSKVSEIERLVTEVKKHTDHVDILFANAGATWGSLFDEHPPDGFSKVMDLNVKSVFFTIQKYGYLYLSKLARPCLTIIRIDLHHSCKSVQQLKIHPASSSPAPLPASVSALSSLPMLHQHTVRLKLPSYISHATLQ